jgi:hypothetical protein
MPAGLDLGIPDTGIISSDRKMALLPGLKVEGKTWQHLARCAQARKNQS